MAGVSTEESGAGSSFEGGSSGQQQMRCQTSEALAEWRSSEQVENGTPSTSPPYWDSSDDEDGGPKPSELYGKYTWKIDKFSQINKRELRSNAFEVGGYKWYILIYPQGCDVCNHLSLFLCVANHDKLLPGWSHFAQFTIAVVNKDPKKSKYSDTLHRFWKKEHDWGWKKFMELSKVMDGFIDADTLIIKAQVQVIRERADRPFRCLDCQYRRELVRVYLTNVEQICRRYVEERRGKLGKLIEDKARWSSFCTFWLGMDQSSRRRMSREKTESLLKVVVKHFFIEKEVTSTLVMDSLYSGLKALEGQNKEKKSKGKYLEAEESPIPIIRIEKDALVLVDDVLLLLERAAMEPLPPKDEKGPQNRTKDEASGEEFSKDSIERDERRLTELGRRTIEIFVLAHIFSKIEVAYQEAVSLKRQEELIREEEAAWLADIEQKGRRGAVDKEKKSKKKQGKQKKNNRKGKDKGRDEKPSSISQDTVEQESPTVGSKDFVADEPDTVLEKSEVLEDVSDASDSVEFVPEMVPVDSEYRDLSPVNWDTDTSEVHPPTEASSSGISVLNGGTEAGSPPSVVDDNSSTSSSDSVRSGFISVPQRGNSRNHKNQKTLNRGRKYQSKVTSETANWDNEESSQPSEAVSDTRHVIDASRSSKPVDAAEPERSLGNKERESGSVHRNSSAKDVASVISSPRSPSKIIPSIAPPKSESKVNALSGDWVVVKKSSSSDSSKQAADRSSRVANSAETATPSKSDTQKVTTPRPSRHQAPVPSEKPVTIEKPSIPMPVMSRPLSAPLTPGPRPPAVSMVSMVQTAPILARSVSAAGRLGPEPSPSAVHYIPQSYRNAIMGNHVTGSSSDYAQNHSSNAVVNASHSYTPTSRMDQNPMNSSFSFGMVNNQHDMLQNGHLWLDRPQMDHHHATLLNDMQSYDLYKPPASGRQSHHVMGDEFPHLDIINDLLDDEHVIGIVGGGSSNSGYQNYNNGPHHMNRQFSFPGGEPGMSSGVGPSTSSCRYERTHSYHDNNGFQHGYGASGNPYDMIPQANPRPFLNGPIDGLMPNQQWQMGGSDLPPYMNLRSTDNDGYSYHHMPEYPNLGVGVNGYKVFRPSNGL
ncbi:hypothetical protein RD792_017451 [Penstemon davidsonii]|uniref:MATH domain-containing protein n=1 Tax=Penstemon davidsonii TaxID=160366 RepID=A0ABR0CMY8_9LAMI|nr:hypothetical protein RD792_017451 [Penstemon davidsonii]